MSQIPDTPAISAFLQRVGAIRVNFKVSEVREDSADGYPIIKCRIHFDRGGEITLKGFNISTEEKNRYAPTETESAAIKQEIASSNWPHSVDATRAGSENQRIRLNCDRDRWFEILDVRREDVRMAWQRVEMRDGKAYLPWTLWSDGEWRRMEPDGKLPIWKPAKDRHMAQLMFHEGSKAARFVDWMINADDPVAKEKRMTHPWALDLEHYEHMGWNGGVNRVYDVDWQEVLNRTWREIIIVADNDTAGREASLAVASRLRFVKTPVFVLIFDQNFPEGFDLADSWPNHETWWNRGDRRGYRGPPFEEYLRPATWATEKVFQEGKGRPTYKIRPQFEDEWVWVETPNVYVHTKLADRLRDESTFNRIVRPFSHVENTAKVFARVMPRVDALEYMPGERHGYIMKRGGRTVINTYRSSRVTQLSGDPARFLDFMEHLIPDKSDREKMLKWCATLIAKPEVRMSYSVLLISDRQGVGKGTLGEAILAPLVGVHNTSFPTENHLESSFNSWVSHKRLAVVGEIYSGNNRKLYDKLKVYLTDEYVDVNEKFLTAYRITNWIVLFACSNSFKALHIDEDDRRWLVPRVTEQQKSEDYWREFYGWLAGDGLRIIKQWAIDYIAQNGYVHRGTHAPTTSLKQEIIAESRSEGQQIAYDIGKAVAAMSEPKIIAIEELRAEIANKRNIQMNDRFLERSVTLLATLRNAGLMEPQTLPNEPRRRFTIPPGNMGASGYKTYIAANFPIPPNVKWEAIKDKKLKPSEMKTIIGATVPENM